MEELRLTSNSCKLDSGCDKGIIEISLSLDLGPGAGHANMLIIDTKSKDGRAFRTARRPMGSLSDAQNNQLHRDVEALVPILSNSLKAGIQVFEAI